MKHEDIFGTEKFSTEFQDDLRRLLASEVSAQKLADCAVRYATEQRYTQEDVLGELANGNVRPENIQSVTRILLFYAQQLMRGKLPAAWDEKYTALLHEWLTRLEIGAEHQKKFIEFITGLLESGTAAREQAARLHFLNVGPPRIQRASAAVDLRFLFERTETNEDENEEPLPGKVLRIEPVTLLELTSTLNDIKENHVFQLAEREIKQLIRALHRAEARCKQVRETIESTDTNALRKLLSKQDDS